jgi:GTPase SAR1 family protein
VSTDSSQTHNDINNNFHNERDESNCELVNNDYRNMMNDIEQIQVLRDIGIESKKLQLPKICVVGDQSTGKSSVIEAISQIKVPRKSGCCTRCPLEINMRRSKPNEPKWKCTVSLVKKYMYSPSSSAAGLGPWKDHIEAPIEFCTLYNKDEVPNALKWAQIATLNPKSNPARYIPDPGQAVYPPEDLQVKFSPNIVRLDIWGADLDTLSFYDLPGIIQSSDVKEESYLVPLVENLVRGYIRDDSCIILLTVPMTSDIATCTALRLVEQEEGALTRARGVLTKPDQFERAGDPSQNGGDADGRFDQWDLALRGQSHSLGLGYGVVMNHPNTKLTHQEARAEEYKFFAEGRWAKVPVEFQESFGVENLQKSLSSLLSDKIRDLLPSIIERIDSEIRTAEEELRQLPNPPTEAQSHSVIEQMMKLAMAVQLQLKGGQEGHLFYKEWCDQAQDFRQEVVGSYPRMIGLSAKENELMEENRRDLARMTAIPQLQSGPQVVDLVDDDDLNRHHGPMRPVPVKRTSDADGRPFKRQKPNGERQVTPKSTPERVQANQGNYCFIF